MHTVKVELTVAELKGLVVDNWVQPALAKFETLFNTRMTEMTAIVDQLVAAVAAQTTQSAGLRVIIEQAVSELTALKTALTAALANATSISPEDAAAIQAVIDSAGTDTALDVASAQALADAVAVNAP